VVEFIVLKIGLDQPILPTGPNIGGITCASHSLDWYVFHSIWIGMTNGFYSWIDEPV